MKQDYLFEHINDFLVDCDIEEKIKRINAIKLYIHGLSPFKSEPVDCVIWEKNDSIVANDYNPNKVAPPEMQLLEVSITNDGYTQPIVAHFVDKHYEVVDGFHRHRVGKESLNIRNRIHGYLPVVKINDSQSSRNDRIASTIRHNRARGKHTIDAMSEIVLELKSRNWKNERIARELGMDEDEILRLCQISGLSEIFKDQDFSRAWETDGDDSDFIELTENIPEEYKETYLFRTTNTSDPERIFHTYDKWECQKNGFYSSSPPTGLSKQEAQVLYSKFLADHDRFAKGLYGVITEWKHSCEHYLTNKAMNRIAWLGQAAACYSEKLSSEFRTGFNLLTETQKSEANNLALEYLNIWMKSNGRDTISMSDAIGGNARQVEIY